MHPHRPYLRSDVVDYLPERNRGHFWSDAPNYASGSLEIEAAKALCNQTLIQLALARQTYENSLTSFLEQCAEEENKIAEIFISMMRWTGGATRAAAH